MDTTRVEDGYDDATEQDAPRRPWGLLAVIALILVAGLTFAATALAHDGDFPADDSVDAGFARDMQDHHAQAVEMAAIVYRRTDNPDIRILAYDMMLTQQGQIGMMLGWLDVWDLSPNASAEPMAWMGHGMSGPMPGMATDEEVASLETLPVPEMNRVFLQLMIRHHAGALDMAAYAAAHAEADFVRTLAGFMFTGQQGEIDSMQTMLDALGG